MVSSADSSLLSVRRRHRPRTPLAAPSPYSTGVSTNFHPLSGTEYGRDYSGYTYESFPPNLTASAMHHQIGRDYFNNGYTYASLNHFPTDLTASATHHHIGRDYLTQINEGYAYVSPYHFPTYLTASATHHHIGAGHWQSHKYMYGNYLQEPIGFSHPVPEVSAYYYCNYIATNGTTFATPMHYNVGDGQMYHHYFQGRNHYSFWAQTDEEEGMLFPSTYFDQPRNGFSINWDDSQGGHMIMDEIQLPAGHTYFEQQGNHGFMSSSNHDPQEETLAIDLMENQSIHNLNDAYFQEQGWLELRQVQNYEDALMIDAIMLTDEMMMDEIAMAPENTRDISFTREEILEQLKTRTCYKDDVGGESNICVICQEGLCQENTTIGMLGCKHEFHADCVVEWLQRKNTCPLCKAVALVQ